MSVSNDTCFLRKNQNLLKIFYHNVNLKPNTMVKVLPPDITLGECNIRGWKTIQM